MRQEHVQVYPSKRIKNHASRKLRAIFNLKGRVVLRHAPNIFYAGDICYGLCYSKGFPGIGSSAAHTIVIAEDANSDMRTYLATLLHEYVHAWQFENGYTVGHSARSGFVKWAKYLKYTQNDVNI